MPTGAFRRVIIDSSGVERFIGDQCPILGYIVYHVIERISRSNPTQNEKSND